MTFPYSTRETLPENPELAALRAEVERLRELRAAVDERDMFINPEMFTQAADEIDCCPGCDRLWYEQDTGAGGCHASERGEYCPNDVAETLRAIGKAAARAALEGKP